MTCKHRWEPTTFGVKHHPQGSYWYLCARCSKTIFAQLRGNS